MFLASNAAKGVQFAKQRLLLMAYHIVRHRVFYNTNVCLVLLVPKWACILATQMHPNLLYMYLPGCIYYTFLPVYYYWQARFGGATAI
jgi:hypothetical protein